MRTGNLLMKRMARVPARISSAAMAWWQGWGHGGWGSSSSSSWWPRGETPPGGSAPAVPQGETEWSPSFPPGQFLHCTWPITMADYPHEGEEHSWQEVRTIAAHAGCNVKLKGRAFTQKRTRTFAQKRTRRPNVLTIKGLQVEAVFKILYGWTQAMGVDMSTVCPGHNIMLLLMT